MSMPTSGSAGIRCRGVTLRLAKRFAVTGRVLFNGSRNRRIMWKRKHSTQQAKVDIGNDQLLASTLHAIPGQPIYRRAREKTKAMKTILDACCGSRMFWFDKADPRALFVDKRREIWPIDKGTPGTIGRSPIVVDPDILSDFSALPFEDCSFPLVVFDPPHIQRTEARGLLTRKYGILAGDWRSMIQHGFSECFRVLIPCGTLVFKWSESQVLVSEILDLTSERPLFGHKSGKQSGTHWIVFQKNQDARAGQGECPGTAYNSASPKAAQITMELNL